MSTRGFTLIELMIVVVIIGILAAIALPKLGNASRAAKQAEAAPILKQVQWLQETYLQQGETYGTLEDLERVGYAVAPNLRYFDPPQMLGTPTTTTYTVCMSSRISDLSAVQISEDGMPVQLSTQMCP